ncbi:ABC transporter substrate-binding protein [Paenarthrobacter sp. NCHU4564]|uniref:ABC transporter substrate-binding protein n=1 Tax=Paenarthrobacter sp. NCHU4564 TaxID=3451353 RepID=UPI003F9C0EB5
MYHRSLVTVSLLAAAAAALSGCGSTDTTGPGSTDTLNMSLSTDPSSLDPTLARSGDDYTMAPLLFDTILRKDENGAVVGGLATEWEAKDAANYSLKIRTDATCSDGKPITPTVVANSLTRFLAPETGSTGRFLTIGSAKATVTPDDVAGTVTVSLTQGWSDFLQGLTLPQSAIICPAGLADVKALGSGSVPGAFSGPYTLASSQAGTSYNLALRDDYNAWPKFAKPLQGKPAKNLVLRPISDYSTLATQLLAGSLDVGVLTDENVDRFANNDQFTTTSTANTTTYLIFNERPGAVFANRPDLRKAVAQAVNPQTYSDIISGSRGQQLLSLGSPQIPCVNTDTSLLPASDSSAASKVLNGVKIRIVGTNLLAKGNEYVAEVLRNAGAEVALSNLDNANWSALTGKGGTDWDINVQGDNNLMGTLTSSLLRVMGPPAESGGRNKTGVVHEDGYAALTAALNAVDSNEKCAAFQTAQASFLKQVDAVPLSTLPVTIVTAKGFSVRTFGDYQDPATLRIDQ